MDKKTILVVDDDLAVLDYIHEILTMYGYESLPYSDASTALTVIASGTSLDLAIVDLKMPEMNGLEFHARIKQLRPRLPCIVVTGQSSVESYLHAMDSGVFEYLNKPFSSRELKAVVAAALEKSEMMTGSGPEQILSPEFGVDQ
jgi:DNA-binding NtrC family response regulator